MSNKPLERDWKLFRKMVPELRERYLQEKNKVLSTLLSDPEKTPTEQFWNTEEQIRKESKILRTCLDGHSRSKMFDHMALMYRYRMLCDNDLKDFSEQLQKDLKNFLSIWE